MQFSDLPINYLLLLLLQRHFPHVSEDEVEAVAVLEDADGLVVHEAVEAAAVHLANLVARLEGVVQIPGNAPKPPI